jgi:hypothetical protein
MSTRLGVPLSVAMMSDAFGSNFAIETVTTLNKVIDTLTKKGGFQGDHRDRLSSRDRQLPGSGVRPLQLDGRHGTLAAGPRPTAAGRHRVGAYVQSVVNLIDAT